MEAAAPERDQPRWAEIAYEAFAPVYDDFTARNDYELWLGEVLPKVEPHGLLERGSLLDVGCGTGNSFIPMLKRGWQVTACDISPSMVELAREKVGGGVELSVADMRELPSFGSFDLVWALDDAVNYVLSEAELTQALSGMRRNLAPSGLLLFDLNTLRSYRSFFAEEQVVEANGRRLLWHGHASEDVPPGSICEASFEVQTAGGGDAGIATELHRQRHFPEAEVLAAMERAGLECLDAFGHGFDAVPEQPLDDLRHVKAVYVARAASARS